MCCHAMQHEQPTTQLWGMQQEHLPSSRWCSSVRWHHVRCSIWERRALDLVQQGGRGLNEERKERWEGKNEKNKSYRWMRNERSRFNMCI
jgi:hypothetical protein